MGKKQIRSGGNRFLIWVESIGGAPRLAEKLSMTPHAVRVWLRGEGPPKVATIQKIVKLSKNKVSIADILNACAGK